MKFNRGYKESREKVVKSAKFTRSCFNCDFFYKLMSDSEEVCQNPNVTKYDMVVTETSIYCTQWELSKRKNISATKSVKGLFKKG